MASYCRICAAVQSTYRYVQQYSLSLQISAAENQNETSIRTDLR